MSAPPRDSSANHQMRPRHVMVRDKRSGIEAWVPLDQAERLIGLPADEIEAALCEFGECESEFFIALEPE